MTHPLPPKPNRNSKESMNRKGKESITVTGKKSSLGCYMMVHMIRFTAGMCMSPRPLPIYRGTACLPLLPIGDQLINILPHFC